MENVIGLLDYGYWVWGSICWWQLSCSYTRARVKLFSICGMCNWLSWQQIKSIAVIEPIRYWSQWQHHLHAQLNALKHTRTHTPTHMIRQIVQVYFFCFCASKLLRSYRRSRYLFDVRWIDGVYDAIIVIETDASLKIL